VLVAGLSACFHQVVQTGRTPGTTVVDKPWVATWIFGLVEAQPIDVRAQCPQGVAVVTTEQSFLNGLVGGLTLGIYTPQHVTITCASSSSVLPDHRLEIQVAREAAEAERIAAVQEAVQMSLSTSEAVVVRF
jgi:hypothetical protein